MGEGAWHAAHTFGLGIQPSTTHLTTFTELSANHSEQMGSCGPHSTMSMDQGLGNGKETTILFPRVESIIYNTKKME